MEKWESKQIMANHLSKMRASVSKGNNSIEYTRIMTYEDYKASLIEGMGSLGYPLRKQVKRDRFVLNSEGLRQTMQRAVNIALEDTEKDLYKFVEQDAKKMISRATEDVLNSISWNGSEFKTNPKESEMATYLFMMAKQLGKNLADNIMYVFNDMMNGGNGKKEKAIKS